MTRRDVVRWALLAGWTPDPTLHISQSTSLDAVTSGDISYIRDPIGWHMTVAVMDDDLSPALDALCGLHNLSKEAIERLIASTTKGPFE